MKQKANIWKLAAGLVLAISITISAVPMTAAAVESGTPERVESGRTAGYTAQVESLETSDYGAPAYGTRAANLQRLASQKQVQEVSKALQPVADAVQVMTQAHNVSVVNYSDADELGLIYQSDGSGVVLVMDNSRIYIATAAHCLKHSHTEVILPDGTRCSASVIYRNTDMDTGFLAVEGSGLTEKTLAAISPAAGADAAALGMKTGDALVAVSSLDSPGASSCIGVLDQLSVAYPNNLTQNVLQFYSETSYGSSGGAVYTQDGIWIGSISGGDTYGTCWAVPYSDILAEFQKCLIEVAAQNAEQ